MAENQNLSAYNTAEERNNEQKRALMQAIAQSGSQGQATYQQNQQQNQQGQQQATQAALSNAHSVTGAPQGFDQYIGGLIQQPFQQRASDINQAQAAFSEDMARQTAGNEQFFGRINAAIPIEQARTNAAVQQIIKEMEEKRLEREHQKQMAAIELQIAQMNLEQAKLPRGSSGGGGGGGGGLSISDMERLQKGALKQYQQGFVADLNKNFGPKVNGVFANSVSKGTLEKSLAELTKAYHGTNGFKTGPFAGVKYDVVRQLIINYYNGGGLVANPDSSRVPPNPSNAFPGAPSVPNL